jgi:hypothetical protein
MGWTCSSDVATNSNWSFVGVTRCNAAILEGNGRITLEKQFVRMGLVWDRVHWWGFGIGGLELSGAAARGAVGNPASFWDDPGSCLT